MTREEASRINGAKSQGPVTEEGRKRSSINRLTHGLSGNTLVIPGEDQELFDELTKEYAQEFQPQTPYEHDLVADAVAGTWRLRRLWGIETCQFELEIDRQRAKVDAGHGPLLDIGRITLAFEKLANDSKALSLLSRYEVRHRRARERAIAELRAIIAKRPKPDPSPVSPPVVVPSSPEVPSTAQPSPVLPTPVLPFEPETARNRMIFTTLKPGATPIPVGRIADDLFGPPKIMSNTAF